MQNSPVKIDVSIKQQELKLRRGRKIIRRYPISSSRFGLGTDSGSNKTPLGKFRISDKIGRPNSHGCIRMRNADVIELFELVNVGTPVTIRQ